MSRFLGTHQNRLDVKGRISIPAPFRTVLRALAADVSMPLVLRPSHRHPCIEGWPAGEFDKLTAPVDRLDLFGDDYEDLSAAVYADAYPVESDREGRIVLPDGLVDHAHLSDAVIFMGMGRIFQIWEPVAAAARREQARAATRERALTLPAAAAP